MQILPLVRRSVATALLPFLLGAPLPTLAATPSPQTALNLALMNESRNQAQRMTMTLRVDAEQKPTVKDGPSAKGNLALRLEARSLVPAAGETIGDNEGRLVIEKLHVEDKTMPIKLDSPLSLQWKMTGGKAYGRIEQAPQSVIDWAKNMGDVDLSEIIGRWIVTDAPETEGTTAFSVKLDPKEMDEIKLIAAKYPPLLVTRVESRTKNTSNEDLWRMRLIMNPAFINAMYREALKDLPKSGKARTDALVALNKSFAEARARLAKMGMVAVVNIQQNRLERFELGARFVDPEKKCTFAISTNRETCRTVGSRTIAVAFGINLLKDSGTPIEIPSNAMTQEQVEALLYPERQINTIPTDNQNLNGSVTLVAPDATIPPYDASRDHAIGSPNPTVTIITYSDFQCPYCKRIQPDLIKLLSDYPLDTRLVYRHFPLSSIHPEAQKAAEASECAAKLGGNDGFWKMHDKLFNNQTALASDLYPTYALEIGLNRDTFNACMASGEMAARVQADVQSGTAAGIQGTPATFFNAKLIEGAYPYTMLREIASEAGAVK